MTVVSWEHVPAAGVRPLMLVILSRRAAPPSLILASRRSRRMRAARWAGDSSTVDIAGSWRCVMSMLMKSIDSVFSALPGG